SSSARALTLADFSNVDFGARVTSVGRDVDGNGTIDTSRNDSSKIGTVSPHVDVNHAPVALADVASVKEDTNTQAIGNVLANDTDVDTTDTHSVTAVTGGT